MSKKAMNSEKGVTYETALAKLEGIVRHLEKGELTLEDSLKAFEEGIIWTQACEEKLSEAKGRVEVLVKKAGGEVKVEESKPE